MAWKISNETKVGVLTAISITLLILGVNFMKGKNVLKKSRYLYARFDKTNGLLPAAQVVMKGLSIGSVYEVTPGDEDLNSVVVTIRLEEQVHIPTNSVAVINSTLLGSTSLEIIKGTATTHLNAGDTLLTKTAGGFLGDVMSKLEPTQSKLDGALTSADSVFRNVNLLLNEKARLDLQQTLTNLSLLSENLTRTAAGLNGLLDAQTGSVTKTFKNLEGFSNSLAPLQQKLPGIADNLEQTTKKLSELELNKTVNELNETIASLKQIIAKANSTDGTVGALINDKTVYTNLNNTINSLNLLMQDLRMNPKRYVNISVFGGKKSKGDPLMKPMATDSVTLEQKP